MILYNVTVSIDPNAHVEWLDWMRSEHIPAVMETGCFLESRISRVHGEEEGGLTFAITYLFYAIKINGFWKQLKEKESIVSYYLFGNLIAIVLLANFLLVNYPEDRVGMYLILLFIN